MKKNVGIYIFDDAEVLDFCGPFEVFSVTDELNQYRLFNIYTISENQSKVTAKNGLKILPDYTIDDCPKPNILIIPGGEGARKQIENTQVISWVKETSIDCEHVLSVCTGAFILAKSKLLTGLKATTHKQGFKLLRELSHDTEILPEARFIDNGKIIIAAGISAGIDMSLYVIEKLLGREKALKTSEYMEYRWV